MMQLEKAFKQAEAANARKKLKDSDVLEVRDDATGWKWYFDLLFAGV